MSKASVFCFLYLEFKEKLLERVRDIQCFRNGLIKTKFWAAAWVPGTLLACLDQKQFQASDFPLGDVSTG